MTRMYFGCEVTIEPDFELWSLHSIRTPSGRVMRFIGMPNRLLTKQSAIMRAWWRCKWLTDGTFDTRYV